MTLRDPADDRDEPSEEEISQYVAGYIPGDEEIAYMVTTLTTDKEILKWAHDLRQSILDAIIEKRADVSDGDE